MEADDLEKLLRQMEEDARRSDERYEEWRVSAGLGTTKPIPKVVKNPAPPGQKPVAVPVPAVDRREWQVYGLRRKYCDMSLDPRLQNAPRELVKNWQEGSLAEMTTGQLHMLARSELEKRKETDKAQQALLMVSRRQREEVCRRFFLYGYAAVQKTLSPQKLEALCTVLAQDEPGTTPDRYALYAVYSMARYIANVTACTQRLQEQGYRNRQEMLEQAQQAAQQKLEQAQQDLNRW